MEEGQRITRERRMGKKTMTVKKRKLLVVAWVGNQLLRLRFITLEIRKATTSKFGENGHRNQLLGTAQSNQSSGLLTCHSGLYSFPSQRWEVNAELVSFRLW
jgi:hypothetical protein